MTIKLTQIQRRFLSKLLEFSYTECIECREHWQEELEISAEEFDELLDSFTFEDVKQPTPNR